MARAFKHDFSEAKPGQPLMYQGGSDDFVGPWDDMPLPSETDGIDFEAELAVVVDRVPMGTPASRALEHVKLVMLANDASLRSLAVAEMKSGLRLDSREAGHELQPRRRDARRARCRIGATAASTCPCASHGTAASSAARTPAK